MLYIFMSDGLGKTAHLLKQESEKKAKELNIAPISFPENGIHPQFHMELADKYLRYESDTIVITHSEGLILRALRRIRSGEITPKDVKVFVLAPSVNKPENICFWKEISISQEGEFIDYISGGFFEQSFNEMFDTDEIEALNELK